MRRSVVLANKVEVRDGRNTLIATFPVTDDNDLSVCVLMADWYKVNGVRPLSTSKDKRKTASVLASAPVAATKPQPVTCGSCFMVPTYCTC